MTAALEFQGVHKSFDGNPALVDAFFTAERGEVHALLGENGAGKSTLMNIACGLYSPDHGGIKVDGQSVVIDGPLRANALGIAMVHQHFKLVENMTVAENIAFCHMTAGPAGKGESLNAVRKRIVEVSGRIGFEIDPDRRIDTLSVSEQQRTEIIKVMMGGADILILDEPTSSLDPAQIREVRELILTLAADRTVIVSTHILPEVQKLATRIMILHHGRIAHDAPAVSDTRVLRVRFCEVVDAGLLTGIKGIRNASAEDHGAWRLEVDDCENAAVSIAERAVEEGWGVIELQPEFDVLEHLFMRLTTGDAPAEKYV